MADKLTKLPVDYSLNNPDTLTKYKTAGTISEKVLAEVSKLVVPGEKIVDICAKGDKLLEQEVSKVFAKTKFKGEFLPGHDWLLKCRTLLLLLVQELIRLFFRFRTPHNCLSSCFCHTIHSPLFR
jgi:hypothetical protein